MVQWALVRRITGPSTRVATAIMAERGALSFIALEGDVDGLEADRGFAPSGFAAETRIGSPGAGQNGKSGIGAADIAEQEPGTRTSALSTFLPLKPIAGDQNASSQLRLRRTAELMSPTIE